MNIIHSIVCNYPLDKMYVPSGWLIAKNNLVDVDACILNEIESVEERFLVEKNFFSDDIFYSIHETHLTKGVIKAVIDIECILLNVQDSSSVSGSEYIISLNIFQGKSKKHIYEFEKNLPTRHELIDELNFLQWVYSWGLASILDGDFCRQDIDNIIRDYRAEYRTP